MINREFFREDKSWIVEFTFPNDVCPYSVNPIKLENGVVTCDMLETNDELKKYNANRLLHKIQDDINELHIEFNDREDDNSVCVDIDDVEKYIGRGIKIKSL